MPFCIVPPETKPTINLARELRESKSQVMIMLVLIRDIQQLDMGLFDTMSKIMDIGFVKHS